MTGISPISNLEDAAEFARLMRLYREETGVDACFAVLDAELADPVAAFRVALLARIDGRAVGCITLKMLDKGRAEIARLYVAPSYRRKGIGQMLMEATIDAARGVGVDQVVLHTLERWRAATNLYRRLGFTPARPYCDVPLDDVLYLERPTSTCGPQ